MKEVKWIKDKPVRGRITPFITLMLLCELLLMLLNFDTVVWSLNKDSYTEVQADITEHCNDALFGIFPRIKVSYTFSGKEYTGDKTLWSELLFFEKTGGVTASINVNKMSPEDFLVKHSYLGSFVGIALVIVMLISMFLSLRGIVHWCLYISDGYVSLRGFAMAKFGKLAEKGGYSIGKDRRK